MKPGAVDPPQRPPRLARVLGAEPDAVWLWAAGQTERVARPPTWPGDLEPGDVIRLTAGMAEIVARPDRTQSGSEFPHPDGEFSRFSSRDGLRFEAVRARAVLLRAIRRFFDRRGFIEVDPPVLAASPGLELHLDAVRAGLRQGMGGAPVERWLTTSPEFHCKRLLAAGFERIYSLGHAFRSGERGGWHNPEFAMLEWYRADAGWHDLVRDTRALVRTCATALAAAGCRTAPQHAFDPRARWTMLSVRRAVQRYAGFDPGRCDDAVLVARRARRTGLEVGPEDSAPDIVVRALVERVEPQLAASHGVVLAPWPATLASLARRAPGAPHLAERFEIYLRGIELANGFNELVDAAEQRHRFEADLDARRRLRRPAYPVDERFLLALAEGCPPAAGVALGVDRLLMVLGGYADIDQVLAFPFERA